MRHILILLLIISFGFNANSQDSWTLDDCLVYARENNIGLKRQQIQTDFYGADLKSSKANLLPNLNFQSSANLNFGRSVDPATNDITFNQTLGNSYGIASSVTVFNGFANLNRVSAAKFFYRMGIELQEQQDDLLSLDIINAYYELIMARGVVKTAGNQLEVTRHQLHRIEVLVQTGAESRTSLLELQSQVSNDKLLLTQAINNEIIGLENLRQFLQLSPDIDFDIQDPSLLVAISDMDITNADSVYSVAREIMPGISALELQTLAREKELKAAIGDASPELRLSGSWGTGYFDANIEGVVTDSFSKQLNENNSQSLQATLAIPIFNRWFNARNIKRAKLSLEDSRLELEQSKNTLYQQVNTSCLELDAIYDEYLAARDNREFSDLTFDAVEKKFQTGLANATEYSEARRQKFSAEINLLRTELQYELKRMTIKFYLTGEWDV